jgi:hypothetical protein
LSSKLYESDDPADIFNRDRENESKISTQRSRVSKNTLLNHEHLKSNRLSTLVAAASTNNLASNTSLLTSNEKLKKSKIKENDEKTSDILNANKNNINDSSHELNNTINSNAMNLLKQIKHHQSARKLNSSASNKNISSNNNNNREANESVATYNEDISENNLSKLTIAVLKLLTQLEIKFPGKNNEQTKLLTNAIYSKLEAYKPKLANYWMIKLDDSKRSKVY